MEVYHIQSQGWRIGVSPILCPLRKEHYLKIMNISVCYRNIISIYYIQMKLQAKPRLVFMVCSVRNALTYCRSKMIVECFMRLHETCVECSNVVTSRGLHHLHSHINVYCIRAPAMIVCFTFVIKEQQISDQSSTLSSGIWLWDGRSIPCGVVCK